MKTQSTGDTTHAENAKYRTYTSRILTKSVKTLSYVECDRGILYAWIGVAWYQVHQTWYSSLDILSWEFSKNRNVPVVLAIVQQVFGTCKKMFTNFKIKM